jgi:hypothetical protein
VQEAFRTPKRHYQKRNFPCHIIVKIPRVQKRKKILKPERVKHDSLIKANLPE